MFLLTGRRCSAAVCARMLVAGLALATIVVSFTVSAADYTGYALLWSRQSSDKNPNARNASPAAVLLCLADTPVYDCGDLTKVKK
jgi:hypothetical protein